MTNKIQTWPLRPWILAAFLAISAFVFYLVIEEEILSSQSLQLRVAVATFIAVGSISFAFALERTHKLWVISFAIVWGIILGFVAHSSFISQTARFDVSFALASGLIAAGIALPLFQTILKHAQFKLPYQDLHEHAWIDVLCWFASWAFVGLSFALAHLLASLFDLIGIDLLKELLDEEWFIWIFIGANFGAALGVLKENERIVASLQKLVMTILSILTPVLCVSLILFLIALPLTGLQALWDTTRTTTPILLGCAIGAITLANAIVRNCVDEESSNKVMRYSAIGLSVCILPLATIALISMQQRIEQHGLTPDRIWGMIAVLVALAYGIAYLWSLMRRHKNWTSNLRLNNTRMAIFLCLVTLFLALPIMNFAQLSVNSQLARISDGRIQANKVDYAAFAFDFGEIGQQALQEMQKSDNKTLVDGATLALAANNKWELKRQIKEKKSASMISSKLTVFPKPVPIPDSLKKVISKKSGCIGEYCLLIWEQGSDSARLLTSKCSPYYDRYMDQHTKRDGYQHCPPVVIQMHKKGDKWQVASGYNSDRRKSTKKQKTEDKLTISDAIKQDVIEIRTVDRKQIFVDGKPVGSAY